MSHFPTLDSFLRNFFGNPVPSQKPEGNQFLTIITFQFTLVCTGVFLIAAILDFIVAEYMLGSAILMGFFTFLWILYVRHEVYYAFTSTLSILIINTLIFVHDARYGIQAGVYLFYFPLVFAIFSTFSYENILLVICHLLITIAGWGVMELTHHSLYYSKIHDYETLHGLFIFCMVTSLCITIVFVYLILQQIRTNAINHEQEKLKSVLDSNNQMLMLINKERKIELFNRRFFDYYQNVYGDTLQIGNNYLDYGNPQNREMEAEALNKAFSGQAIQKDMLVMMGNVPTWMSLNFVPVVNKRGEIHNVAFSVLDISERKNYEKSLSETNAILTKLNHELDHFIYRSSHDMRAPLASVLGLVELFQTEEDESEREEYISMIGKSVHKLDQLLIDITQYAKNKKLEIRNQPLYFSEIVNELIEALRFAKNAQSIAFKVTIIQETAFYSDEERVRSIIGNLLSNAVRYRSLQVESFVEIAVMVNEKQARISITDNGIGIESEYLSRIFDMFFKVSHKSVGSGLGLYIVKETVTALRGSINVKSAVGLGTTFIIELPQPHTGIS
ncbi:PAS domain-containing sensor histidine kinase [Xanthocytophaga agilis]|uniref:histidine kinase n=1 Tax=Xanthocytophaga agilis TaxID=3048010 RepID=A0AAE3R6F1_9BACT|nr:ATP-binding protein [Xanthocytophaga agilis]MDJ1502339.1 ATP-binding protein [Xanthocytophaga agilis]